MNSLKEYLLETLIYITEAKLPEFVNKYMKVHANHSAVQENPDRARELIAAAHPFAGDHDEAVFLTKHLLDGFYIPGEDDSTMSMITKTWRSARAKGYISKEEKLAGTSHDDVIARFDAIPQLANVPKGLSGKKRKSLSVLKPHKIGTINHPQHGKLDVYHFDKDNSANSEDREIKRKEFSNLCSEGRYSWCVLPANNSSYFTTYSQRGSGFFLYVDENGISRMAHGHGDRATPEVPGGVVVGPRNEGIENQEEVKRATMALLPPGKREAYGLANNLVPETDVKEFIYAGLKHVNSSDNKYSDDTLSIAPGFHPHLDDEILNDMQRSSREQLKNSPYNVFKTVNTTLPLKKHILNSIINNPSPPKEDLTILKNIDVSRPELFDDEIKNAILQTSKHESPSVRRALAGMPRAGGRLDWLDDLHTELMKDPDEGVRHNALIGYHMTPEKGHNFIFEQDNPLQDKLKVFFSRSFAPGWNYASGRGNELLRSYVSFDDLVKPQHREFLTNALKIDRQANARPNDMHFTSDALGSIYHRTPVDDVSVLKELVAHPNLPSSLHSNIMNSPSADEETIINGLKNPVASKEMIEKYGTHENPNIRLAAFKNPSADIEFAVEGLSRDSDPHIRKHLLPFVKNMSKNLKRYIAPNTRYDSHGNFIHPTEQHLRNRRYILNADQEDLLNPFYDVVSDDHIDEGNKEKLLLPIDKVISHMRNTDLSASTHYGITKYLRNNRDHYNLSETNPKLHKEIEDYIERPGGAWSVPQLKYSDKENITPQMPFTEQKTFSKKIIRESIISNIQNYFNKL